MLELHPLCTLFPRMSGAEFEALKTDIVANGQRHPIIISDGMILDGGNRYRACIDAGIEPETQEFNGGSIVSFVLSANLHRRHLTPGQQAAIVASAQDWAAAQKRGGLRGESVVKKSQSATLHFASAADRAAESGASLRTQKMADKVAKAAPELARKVGHGELSLPKAHAIVTGKDEKKPEPEPLRSDELIEAHATIRHLSDELDRLKDNAAVEFMDGSEEDKAQAAETLASLRDENNALRAENAALKAMRDRFQAENAQLMRQCAMQRKEIEKLKGAK
jgi:hypothetical protein